MESVLLRLGAHFRRKPNQPAQGPFSTATEHPPQKGISPEKAEHPRLREHSLRLLAQLVTTPRPCSGARPPRRGARGRPRKASRKGARSAALLNTVPTCSERPLAPAPRPAPRATERAARSRHSGSHKAAQPGPKLRENFNFAPRDIAVGEGGGGG